MGAAAAPIAGVSQIAAMGLGAYGSYMKGKGTQAADEYKAASLERSAQYGRLAASETNTQMTEHLNTTLGNIDVIRAAAHADPTSPTGAAVRDTEEYIGTRQRNVAVFNLQAQADQEESDADYLRKAGKFALGMGELGAVTSLAGGFGRTNFAGIG
jgi:hypothetical protein